MTGRCCCPGPCAGARRVSARGALVRGSGGVWWSVPQAANGGLPLVTPPANHVVVSLRGGALVELEHARRDPKDGELCLCRVKPGETLVEARSGADVQIARQTWV